MNDSERCFFVGIHNKPGLDPLCSSTKTGKMIDRIIKFTDIECVKTNLYYVNYLPKYHGYRDTLAREWWDTHKPCPDDIIVLLGNEVNDHFDYKQGFKYINLAHPASIWSNEKKTKYFKDAISKIKMLCL